jgi:hypothetical protein
VGFQTRVIQWIAAFSNAEKKGIMRFVHVFDNNSRFPRPRRLAYHTEYLPAIVFDFRHAIETARTSF